MSGQGVKYAWGEEKWYRVLVGMSEEKKTTRRT
jgi:hypothetical protein